MEKNKKTIHQKGFNDITTSFKHTYSHIMDLNLMYTDMLS